MTLLEHLNRDGVIRFNRYTKKIVFVYDGLEINDIQCSEKEIWALFHDNICDFYTNNSHAEGSVMVISRTDKDISISQRDREVFQAIVSHWDDTGGGLPGNCSYNDLFDLCDKFEVPQPNAAYKSMSSPQEH